MSKRLGRIIGCKARQNLFMAFKRGFPDGSNIRSKVSCRGEAHRYNRTVHLDQSPCRDTKQNWDKKHNSICNIIGSRIGWVLLVKEILFEGTLVIGLILRSLWGLYKIHETLWFYLVSL